MEDSPDSGTDVPEATAPEATEPQATVPQGPSWVVQPEIRPTDAIPLWTPRGIGWASVLLGYPGAIVLAALNWQRLGRGRKAIVHVAVAIVGTWVLILVPRIGSFGLLVGIAVGYYLYRAQQHDQLPLASAGRVVERGGAIGALLALGATILIAGSGVLIAVAVGAGGPAFQRGVVLFGTRAGTDVCAPAGQTVVFGPSDPIFVGADLRETVQPGSDVVFEIETPNGVVGPLAVTAQPPFDCLGSAGSIGPLDPGAYTFHYRYDAQPGSPDLATGTFTVLPGPRGSAASPSGPAAVAKGSSPGGSPTAASPSTATTCAAPTAGVFPHQAPEIEAVLPASVAGRPLTRWSVHGECWLELSIDSRAKIDTFVALFKTPTNPNPVDDGQLVYGIAGRSAPTDPPFFVYAAFRPANDAETALAMTMFFGNAGFHDPARASDLTRYQLRTIAGKPVHVGTADLLSQDDHQHGRPFLYQTPDDMFLVITDDDAWAADAIGQLP